MADRQELNRNLAQMLKGGVIMDVTTPEQAKIAEQAGACAVMALERIPADIRAAGGVSRMSDPAMIKGIQAAVSIPVMAKCRIGHIAEARILEAIEIDYIDESEVLSPADDVRHIDKNKFNVPFVCGARDLGEALRRIGEGATMIRTKGEPGTGDVVQAVRHMRKMQSEIRRVVSLREDELYEAAKELAAPLDLVRFVHENGKLPVVNFAAGGVATPADAALMMELGAEGVFVGSGIFKSGDPAKRASAIVQAVTNWQDSKLLAKLSENLGPAMIRTKGEPGTGDVVQAVRHMRKMQSEIRRVVSLREDELYEAAKELAAPLDLVRFVHENGKLPVVNFAAGGVATPADAALMMELGAEGVFVGSGIFKSGDPAKRASAIVQAVTNWQDSKLLAKLSENLGPAMVGINADEIETIMEERGK